MFQTQQIFSWEAFLVLCLDTLSIQVLLCSIKEDQLNIQAEAKSRLPYEYDIFSIGIGFDLSDIVANIQKCLDDIENKGHKIPQDIIVGCNHPYFLLDNVVYTKLRDTETKVVQPMEMSDLFEETQRISFDKLRLSSFLHSPVSYNDLQLITTCVNHISLDSKTYLNPLGATGSRMKIGVLNVFCSKLLFQHIKTIVKKIEKNLVSVIPTPIILPNTTIEQKDIKEASVFIHFGHTFSTFSLQKNGEVVFFFSLPLGFESLFHLLEKNEQKHVFEIQALLQKPHKIYEQYTEHMQTYIHLITQGLHANIEGGMFSGIDKVYVSGDLLLQEHTDIYTPYIQKLFSAHTNIVYSCEEKDKTGCLLARGLAKTGARIVHTQKDPVLKILRSVLYRHEQ